MHWANAFAEDGISIGKVNRRSFAQLAVHMSAM
jgi:hypothetical protein